MIGKEKRQSSIAWFPLVITLIVIGSWSEQAWGQEIEFQVNAPQSVVVGQQFRVVYTVNAEGSNFRGPDFKGFSLLSGPNASSSSNIQIINGQVSSTFTYSYTYFLLADKEGSFQVGSAQITIAGKEYQTRPFQVKVVQGQQPKAAAPSGQGGNQPQSGSVSSEDVFFRVSADKANPYQGQQVILVYRIYTRLQINLPGGMQQPPLQGFWMEDLLKDEKAFPQSRETVNGQEYVVVEYKRLAVYPQRSGRIVIEPFEIQVNARVHSRSRTGDPFFDQFFGGSFFNSFSNVPITIKTNSLTLDVKALPGSGRPLDFNGAVGQYTFQAEASPVELKTNDAITLRYTIKGSGNLKMIDKMPITFPSDFETYDPKVLDNISTSRAGMSGSRTFEYLAIPRAPGKHIVKPVIFHFFNPETGQYQSISSPEFSFNVEKGEGDQVQPAYSGVSQEDIKYIGSDIRFIRTGEITLMSQSDLLYGTMRYWIMVAGMLLLFAGFLVMWRRRIRLLADVTRQRNRKASRLARRRLKTSRQLLADQDQKKFYDTLASALWGYVSDKLGIPRANLSMESADEHLKDKGISDEVRGNLRHVLNECEFRRYAPGSEGDGRQSILDMAFAVITHLENELRK